MAELVHIRHKDSKEGSEVAVAGKEWFDEYGSKQGWKLVDPEGKFTTSEAKAAVGAPDESPEG